MLDWLKRIASPSPRESENQTPTTEEQVERLLTRFETTSNAADETPPIEEQVEQGVSRFDTPSRTFNASAMGSSQMRIIVVASQKGGVGKTTVAAHLAVSAGLAGQGPAVLVDTDPQGSLTEWWEARREEHEGIGDAPALVTVKLDDLDTKLIELRNSGAAIVIIDTPPALTASIEKVITTADLVLIPTRPGPHDLRAIGATVRLTQRAHKPFLFVVNGATPRANITAQAVAALSEHGRVSPVILYQRTDYAASMIDGRTVMETGPIGRSAQELAELWKCVYDQMNMRAAA